jgi:hypothetical protein
MDFDKMPLEELLRLRSQVTPQAAPSNPAPQALDFDAMPLEQLMAMREQIRAAQSPQQQAPGMAAPTNPSTPEETVARERAELLFNNPRAFDAGRMGLARRAFQGATMGFGDEAIAALSTPIEMVKRGTLNPAEGYRYAKAQEDAALAEAKDRQGILGTVAEIGGSVGSGIGIARGIQAAPAAASRAGQMAQALLGGTRGPGNVVSRVGTAAGSGAVYGAVQGAGEGSGLEDRAQKAAMGAGIGALAGGAVQGVGEVAKRTLGFVGASMNPQGYADRQIARAVSESKRAPDQMTREMAEAAAAGQPYTVADALGNAGQRQLSVVARNPGAGRQQTVEFLDGRQAGQGRRLSNLLAEGLNAPRSAAQTKAEMEAARDVAANINYGAARGSAGAVDPTRAIAAADDFLSPGVTRLMSPQSNIADDSVEALVGRARRYLTDGNSVLTDFDGALRAKREIDRMIKKNPDVRELYPIRNSLDDALAATSQPYANARNTFRGQSQAIDAIDEGRNMAMRGRTEDTIPRFQSMTPDQQAAARVGYADPLIEKIQGGRMGTNKAADFTSDASKAELPAFAAPGRADPMMRAIDRENIMFDTRHHALGGSRTADNINDNLSVAVSPEIFTNLASGNFKTAAKNILMRSGDYVGGNTPAVREVMAKGLLRTGKDADLETFMKKTIESEEMRRQFMAALLRGAQSGGGGATADQLPARR